MAKARRVPPAASALAGLVLAVGVAFGACGGSVETSAGTGGSAPLPVCAEYCDLLVPKACAPADCSNACRLAPARFDGCIAQARVLSECLDAEAAGCNDLPLACMLERYNERSCRSAGCTEVSCTSEDGNCSCAAQQCDIGAFRIECVLAEPGGEECSCILDDQPVWKCLAKATEPCWRGLWCCGIYLEDFI